MNDCAKPAISASLATLLIMTMVIDADKKQIKSMQDQNTSLQSQFGEMQQQAIKDAFEAKKAALVAEETARLKTVEAEEAKKKYTDMINNLKNKGCK